MNCILHACVSAPLKKPELFCSWWMATSNIDIVHLPH